ncbi:hypothetical protein J7E68_01655 [Microbacterium sp. ISL-103]|uniref:hypothetical protein n=1 Tax=Microbacterium sp. ISL-103 TaxID=2819156 RepID=UPI001BE918CC|nr:hypothetical protein [Microbacterium sp. ISL-103]MBT2473313.1 hypothetical protein [Microbacterium sp. ISL-103]
MGSQVAVTEVAVVPTFKGFRKVVNSEADGAAKTASTGFSRTFAKTGTDTGKTVGAGFKKAFEQSAQGTSSKVTKALEADVAKTSRALSTARLKEQDAIGKVRLAQAQLNEANKRYEKDSSQVIRAQERLATASRQLENAHEGTERATDDLKRSQGELARAADRAGDELADAGERGVTGFRSSVVGGVKSFAAPLVAAFAALGIGNIVADAFRGAKDFVLGTIDIASDLNESVNAVQVAYGDAADEVLKLGDNSAKAFGLSKRDLNAYATQFSAFVNTLAGSGGDVAGTLEQLVGRGTDFASVFNLEVSEALQVFQSGLAGETEPLRKFGIDLSAATIQQYAYANGIAETGTQLTEAQKVQARYGALLEQTDKVAGDFVNTQDELANKNRINAAAWDDIQAKIGEGFLPVAQELANIVGNDLLPVIAKLAEEEGPGLAKAFADILPDLTTLAKELLPQLPSLIQSFSDGLPGMIALLGAIAPLLIAITQGGSDQTAMYKGLFDLMSGDKSFENFATDLNSLSGPIGDLGRWGTDLTNQFMEWFSRIPMDVSNGVNQVVGFIGTIPVRVQAGLGALGNLLFSSGRALMDGFLRGIRSMVGEITSTVSGAIEWVMGFFPNSPAKRGPLSGSGWTQIGKSGEAFWDQWLGGMGGEGPEFPGFPDPGTGGPAGSSGAVVSSAGGAGHSVSQTNHFDKTDPAEAVELANQQLTAMLRSA